MLGEGRGVAIGARRRVGALSSEVGAGLCGLTAAWARGRWRSGVRAWLCGLTRHGPLELVHEQPLGLSGVADRAARVPPPGVVVGTSVVQGM